MLANALALHVTQAANSLHYESNEMSALLRLVIVIVPRLQTACPAVVQHPSSNELKTAIQSAFLSEHRCPDEMLPVPRVQGKVLTFEMKLSQPVREEPDNYLQDKEGGLKSRHGLGLQQ